MPQTICPRIPRLALSILVAMSAMLLAAVGGAETHQYTFGRVLDAGGFSQEGDQMDFVIDQLTGGFVVNDQSHELKFKIYGVDTYDGPAFTTASRFEISTDCPLERVFSSSRYGYFKMDFESSHRQELNTSHEGIGKLVFNDNEQKMWAMIYPEENYGRIGFTLPERLAEGHSDYVRAETHYWVRFELIDGDSAILSTSLVEQPR